LLRRHRGSSAEQLGERSIFVRGGAAEVELNDALAQLSAEHREILLLKYVDGLTYAELAERLDVPQGTVMSRLYHAREKMRQGLALEPRTGNADP
jgi:RNA polymerase sigma factor (sigma-70 family)